MFLAHSEDVIAIEWVDGLYYSVGKKRMRDALFTIYIYQTDTTRFSTEHQESIL